MECKYCGFELNEEGTYNKGLPGSSDYEVLGYIYRCEKAEGFETVEGVKRYMDFSGKDFDLDQLTPEDVRCDSERFDGFFYSVDGEEEPLDGDELEEGYPI